MQYTVEAMAVDSSITGELSFGEFRLDPANALLWRGHDRVARCARAEDFPEADGAPAGRRLRFSFNAAGAAISALISFSSGFPQDRRWRVRVAR